jgi:hypothetical protein
VCAEFEEPTADAIGAVVVDHVLVAFERLQVVVNGALGVGECVREFGDARAAAVVQRLDDAEGRLDGLHRWRARFVHGCIPQLPFSNVVLAFSYTGQMSGKWGKNRR